MPRAEGAPKNPESLSVSERKTLTADVRSYLTTEKLGIMMDQRLKPLSPYILANRLMRFRQKEEITQAQRTHVGKMVALGAKQFPKKTPIEVKSMEEFMQFLTDEIPEEMEVVAEFPPDLKKLPAPWRSALTDLKNTHKYLVGG